MKKADEARIGWIKEDGCCACRKLWFHVLADAHHILSGGRRIGHEHTIPLCPWHHRGIITNPDWSREQMEQTFGPSMARNKPAFVKAFGSELELLEYTNQRYKEAGFVVG